MDCLSMDTVFRDVCSELCPMVGALGPEHLQQTKCFFALHWNTVQFIGFRVGIDIIDLERKNVMFVTSFIRTES